MSLSELRRIIIPISECGTPTTALLGMTSIFKVFSSSKVAAYSLVKLSCPRQQRFGSKGEETESGQGAHISYTGVTKWSKFLALIPTSAKVPQIGNE